MKHLKDLNIGVSIHYPTPLPFLRAYDYLNHKHKDFPISNDYSKEILSLPMFPELGKNEISFIVETINSFYQ